MNENTKIGDVASSLGVSLQTIRNWLKVGGEFFSQNATKTTGKRFTPADIQQMQRIKSLLAEGLTFEDIPARLPAAPQVVDDIPKEQPDQQEPSNALQPTEYLDQLMAILEQQRETYQETIGAKDETIQVLRSENERLRDELERSRLPWWKRLSP